MVRVWYEYGKSTVRVRSISYGVLFSTGYAYSSEELLYVKSHNFDNWNLIRSSTIAYGLVRSSTVRVRSSTVRARSSTVRFDTVRYVSVRLVRLVRY